MRDRDRPSRHVVRGSSVSGRQRNRRPATAISPAGLLLAVLLGTWLGHSLEYLRVWGSAQFANAMMRSVHAYFGPVGASLVILGAVAVHESLRLARRLEQQVARFRAALLGGPRAPATRDGRGEVITWTPCLPTLLIVVWVLQLGLYVVQENLEARLFALPAPALGALTGIHALAPIVHLAVAGAVTAVVWLTRWRITQLVAEVRKAVDALVQRSQLAGSQSGVTHLVRAWTPRQRFGVALWARPPPARGV